MLRLKSASDFERVRRDGRSHAHPLVVLVARRRAVSEGVGIPAKNDSTPEEPPTGTRVGVVAGRAVGNAVARNRAKRLLREAVRAHQAEWAPGWDVVLIARAPLKAARLPETRAALGQLLARAGMLVKKVSNDG